MRLFCFFLTCIIAVGCTSFKSNFIKDGGHNEAIKNAIIDFSHTCKLHKEDSIFLVSVHEIDIDLLAIRIGKNNIKLLLTADAEPGNITNLPSRYVINNGKFFFWEDNDYPLTENILALYRKYNLLQNDEGGAIIFPDFLTDDTQKAAHYYFCKNDLTKYKKIITSKGIGFYSIPKVKCAN